MNRRVLAAGIVVIAMAACGSILVANYYLNERTMVTTTSASTMREQTETSCVTLSLGSPSVNGLYVWLNNFAVIQSGCGTMNSTMIVNWGDGSYDTNPNGPIVHAYGSLGTYTITMTIVASNGKSASASVSVTLTSTQLPSCGVPTITLGTPTVTGLSVTLVGNVSAGKTVSPPCLITSMSQSWGDGTSTTFNYINAAHTYSSPGTYVIRVTANESDGKTASASISVTVT